ncbi:hypothetical protein F441_12681 [Phytophthora nicotianae CJ01A1]|uniref:Uncharacterized protein n=2 Tax=Phytophthora nicotianae TaxID=4792 RepID=W2N287_PHYNI|nr:hypothetical protein L915_12441 [Phytophthora nicotianae]ETL35534.1 hypothetical protein L916_12348 [Phytophthora nicotianae]ETL88756.1 hypothetical protein L917_12191 [Phytophthora nicotianae]ETM42003.1 hypothetical protein L914_12272 [Phytophthora nicotianae]ETP11828.1 hypothetical protein F441_12681 [Phytophthora nicotianae CJ01A1]
MLWQCKSRRFEKTSQDFWPTTQRAANAITISTSRPSILPQTSAVREACVIVTMRKTC